MRLKPEPIKHQQPTLLATAIYGGGKELAERRLDPAYLTLIEHAHAANDHNILRLPESAKKMGRANSTYWQDVKNGIAPPPIRLGKRSVGWLTIELDAILAARALASRTNKPLDIGLFVSILVSPRLSIIGHTHVAGGSINV